MDTNAMTVSQAQARLQELLFSTRTLEDTLRNARKRIGWIFERTPEIEAAEQVIPIGQIHDELCKKVARMRREKKDGNHAHIQITGNWQSASWETDWNTWADRGEELLAQGS